MLEERASREGLLRLSSEVLRNVLKNELITDVYDIEDVVFAR